MAEVARFRRTERRSRIEIYMGVLQVIRRMGYAGPTRIMYRSNLSYAPLKRILQSLVKEGFVEAVEEPSGRRLYRLTEEGRRALETLENACLIARKIGEG